MTAPAPLHAQQRFEDSPSVLTALRSPRLLTREVLAGVVTTLALIPEVISFSVIAGVDPKVSLVASVVLALTMSILGGRPAMITAAAGSVALVIAPLVKDHGVQYVLPTVILAGIVQIVFGATGLARLMRFIPRSVMLGFVNALGVLIFLAQVPHLLGVPWLVYPLFVLTVVIILVLPRFTRAVPAPLVAIVVVTAIVVFAHLSVPNVGDEGPMGGGLPGFTPFLVPLTVETLQIIWPTALSVAFVGLMETLLTAKLVDDLTETRSHKGRESWALGVANIAAGFYGGIAGCAMIGQTIVNVKIGRARTRISTVVASLVLLLLVTALSGVMAQIPMVALAAVMMIVAITTVNWHSVKPSTLRRMPVPETIVMGVTIVVVTASGNLALGVIVGVVLAMVLFARRVAHVIRADRTLDDDERTARYRITGPLFFGSSNDLVDRFSYADDPDLVVVDFTHAQIWDASSVAALDAIETKYAAHGTAVEFVGLDERSARFHRRLTGRL
ncbi:SulP family inorganic anion transporter [Subtercola boreus]|uniref:Sodium-independent anion transporter n=1 Tax=Subtercola boreus TaxID=120213 RepID=A0A3E0W8T0_9MICO|nr:SulP family inorganic anion transporter [Subtercola boreus]RFA19827.1 sodium-independent anion transporter [Subtercola boreus]RFA19894.1 sodium-independent anion transporter [Subtercola boreus]RFA26287.1 sodium-independent anion transporter [Subtercola boreus]